MLYLDAEVQTHVRHNTAVVTSKGLTKCIKKDLQVCVCVCVCVLLGSLHTVMHDHSEKRQHQET